MREGVEESRSSSGARHGVYTVLREAIVSGRFAPGRKLSENELAGELGVSRTPVREALAMLRDERLVAIRPQLGTYVTLISDDAVADAAFIREALECAAVRLTAEGAGDAGLAQLRGNVARQGEAVEAGDLAAFDRLDDDLHKLLCELSGRRMVWDLSRRANGHLARVRRLSLPDPGYLREMVTEHEEIIRAIERHEPDIAEHTLRHHLRMVLSHVPEIRRAHPDFFAET